MAQLFESQRNMEKFDVKIKKIVDEFMNRIHEVSHDENRNTMKQ